MGSRVSSPIFIGRASELAALSDALDRAEAGTASCVLIGGEAGIGKSRLVGEFAAYGRDRGALILEGACVGLGTDEGLPFAPIAELLRGLVGKVDEAHRAGLLDAATSELTRLAPELGEVSHPTGRRKPPTAWAQTRLFEGLLTLIARLGERQPTIAVLEDLHWADRSSRDIVSFIARNARSERLCLVGTYRTDDLHRRHPLRPWLAEMKRLPRVERIDLARFDRGELTSQLAAIQGSSLEPALIATIVTRSEGNPFFAEELLAAAIGGEGEQLPDTLREVLLSRVGSLSEGSQRLLGAAAVGGRTVDDELLGRVAEMDEAKRASALRELISTQLLIQASGLAGPSYAFRHALLQEAVYNDLLPSQRQKLHGAYASALGELPVPEGAARATHFSSIAHHASAVPDRPMALRSWIEAARASFDAYAFVEASHGYERAIDLWDRVPDAMRPSDIDKVRLLHDAAMAFELSGEPHRAVDYARQAVDLFDPTVDPARAATLLERLAWSTAQTGDQLTALAVMQEAATLLGAHPPSVESAWVVAGLGYMTLAHGGYRRAIDLSQQAIAHARAVGARDAEAYALDNLGQCFAILGDCERGLAMLRQSLALSRDSESIDVQAAVNLSSTLLDCDQPEEALSVSLEWYEWAKRHGMARVYAGYLGLFAGHVMTGLGRWQDAQAVFDEFGANNPTGFHRVDHAAFSGFLAVRTGRGDAAGLLRIAEIDGRQLMADVFFTGRLFSALIEQALVHNRLRDARTKVDEGLAWLSASDDVRYRSGLLQLAVRVESEAAAIARSSRDMDTEARAVGDGLARMRALQELITQHVEGSSPVFAEARGNLALAEAEVTRLTGRSNQDAWGRTADAFAARRRPYEVAWCRFRQAEAILEASGSRAHAAQALGEAWSICVRLGAVPLLRSIEAMARMARLDLPVVPTDDKELADVDARGEGPATSDEAADPFGLTTREREVLALLAGGYTNRRIAESLFISPNTAGVHVSHILGKLGAANRVEAAAVAVRLGLAGNAIRER